VRSGDALGQIGKGSYGRGFEQGAILLGKAHGSFQIGGVFGQCSDGRSNFLFRQGLSGISLATAGMFIQIKSATEIQIKGGAKSSPQKKLDK
jgi:hypothetical protein